MSTEDPTPTELQQAGELDRARERLQIEFDRARTLETQNIQEFEKVLWLANSGAATVTLGFVTTTETPELFQFVGSCSFVLSIICLLAMRMVGEINASRDRQRRQKASERFFLEGLPISIFETVRDRNFRWLALSYRGLKQGATLLFVVGCILTLVGIYPDIQNAGAT